MNHQFPEIVTMPFKLVEALIDIQTLKKCGAVVARPEVQQT